MDTSIVFRALLLIIISFSKESYEENILLSNFSKTDKNYTLGLKASKVFANNGLYRNYLQSNPVKNSLDSETNSTSIQDESLQKLNSTFKLSANAIRTNFLASINHRNEVANSNFYFRKNKSSTSSSINIQQKNSFNKLEIGKFDNNIKPVNRTKQINRTNIFTRKYFTTNNYKSFNNKNIRNSAGNKSINTKFSGKIKNKKLLNDIKNNGENSTNFHIKKLLDLLGVSKISGHLNEINESLETALKAANTSDKVDFNRRDYKLNLQYGNESNKSNQTHNRFFDSLIKIATNKNVSLERKNSLDDTLLESDNATVTHSENVLTKKMASGLFSYEEKKRANREQSPQVGDEAEQINGFHQMEVKVKAAVIKRSRSSSDLNQSRVVTEAQISFGNITATTTLPLTTGSGPATAATKSFIPSMDKSSNIPENYKMLTTESLLEITIEKTAVASAKNSLDVFTSTQPTTVAQVESVLQPLGEMGLGTSSSKFGITKTDLKISTNDNAQKMDTLNRNNLTIDERCENCSVEYIQETLFETTDDTTTLSGRLSISLENMTTASHINRDVVSTTDSGAINTEPIRLDDKSVVKHEKQLIRTSGVNEHFIANATLKPTEYPWPVKKEAVVEGDIILGGLMMVHERKDSITCGPVMPQGGIQALEAMLYTIDYFNNSPQRDGINITLGAHILDDCDKDTYGLEMAVDFIKGSISNIDGAEYSCNRTQVRKVISGVVGAASSVTSIQVANLLRLFKIPQVSFFSTSPELSNKQRFEYFSRTIPSDHYQVKAMVDIVIMLNWSYVSIIYEESNYGIKGFEELEDLLAKKNICIAVKEKLVKDSGVANESAYDTIVTKLLTKPRARGVIIFGSDQEVAGVMRAVRRNNATGSFSWIGSDGWSGRTLVSDGNEAEVEGTLSVQPKANPVNGFEEYFLGLNVENNKRNPWFVEFWEHHFECRYANSSRTPYNQNYTRMCTGHEKLTNETTAFENQLQFVSDAVMAFGYAILDMHKELCENRTGLCDAMKPTKGTELLKYLKKVNFTGLSGDQFNFDENGDGPARYNIIHFKQYTSGKYSWTRVGEYAGGKLNLTMSEIQFKHGHPEPPESVCSLPCDLGQAKKYVEGESCCWHCFNCTQYQIRHPTDPTQCIGCPMGTVPDSLHVRCVDIPEEYLLPDSGWAIGAMALSSSGILITMFVCGVFIRHNDTPVVRASGRELSYVLLAGILMCYCVTYALVLRPNDIVCGIQRFGAGFCFTVVYAALLTKTNRISRIFNAGKSSAKRPSFISPRSQLIICSGLVAVQILINGIWMVISPPKAIHHYPTREDNLLVCSSYIDASYMIAFSYPILLIIVCTIYAVLTRKIPEAFNESKHIGFTMYTTCVIWLAFVPLYFGTANHVALRITSMSVTISLSASVTVACLFSPKLYIILIRPERNIRQSMMPMRYSAINKSTTATTNSGAGSMMAAVMVTAATCNQKNQIEKHVPPPEGISEKEVYENSDKAKPDTKDSSTQTIPISVPNNDLSNNSSEDRLPKVNNNHNDPASLSHGVQFKEISL